MGRFINIIIVALFCLTLWPDEADARGGGGRSYSSGGTVSVRGYTRRDGTYVSPHTRSAPRRSYWPYAGAAVGARYLPSRSLSTREPPPLPTSMNYDPPAVQPVAPPADPIKYASPSSEPVIPAVPAFAPPPTQSSQCVGKGWCYVITRADGATEASNTPAMDISYPPAPGAKPYRALIYNNQ